MMYQEETMAEDNVKALFDKGVQLMFEEYT